MTQTIFFFLTNWSSAIYFTQWTEYGNFVYLKQPKYTSIFAAFEAKDYIYCEKCLSACQSNVLNEFDKVYPFKIDINNTCKMNNRTWHYCLSIKPKTYD